MAREDTSGKQIDVKSYDACVAEWVAETEEVFFNFQQDHDYYLPLKDESNQSESDEDILDDVVHINIKEEDSTENVEVNKSVSIEENENDEVSTSFVKTEQKNNYSSDEEFLGFDDTETVNPWSLMIEGEKSCPTFPLEEIHRDLYKKCDRKRNNRKRSNRKYHYRCDCGVYFKYKSTLSKHVKKPCQGKSEKQKEMRLKPHTCYDCGKTLCDRNSLVVHMRQHTGQRPFNCTECNKSFYQKVHLTDHIETNHTQVFYKAENLKPFYCVSCNVGFRRKRSFLRHSHSHQNPKPSVPRKNRVYTYDDELFHSIPLNTHYSSDSKEKIYPCPVCCKIFSLLRKMKQHLARTHLGNLPHVCPYCPKSFLRNYELELHVRKHTADRPFPCDLCGLSFSRKSIMDTHRTIHTGEKSYSCQYCSLSFNRKSKLNIHSASHTGQYAYCAVCNKRFADKSYIIGHFKIHTNQKGTRRSKRKNIEMDPLQVDCETSYD